MATRADVISAFCSSVQKMLGKSELSRKDISLLKKQGLRIPNELWNCKSSNAYGAGFSLDLLQGIEPAIADMPKVQPMREVSSNAANTSSTSIEMYIPEKNPCYVATGDNYKVVYNIISSKEFFPCYIYGIAGIGKTSSIEHACAVLKRPFFRVQITRETIDEDLIGSMKLVNGNTVWQDGPIISAYRHGAVVVLDEMDLNANLMILQGILERKPFYIKQTGELVHPAEGFQVFATGNTKGDGMSMRFVGTTVLNDAFLDRFAITLEQKFPTIAQEQKIIAKYCEHNNISVPEDIMQQFVKFLNLSRQNFTQEYEAGTEDAVYISTRRIGFILKSFKMTGNMKSALDMSLSRFNNEQKDALLMLWKAVSEEAQQTDTNTNTNSEN